MTAVIVEPKVEAFDAPETTAEKLGRRFAQRIDWDRVDRESQQNKAPVHVPGLDLAQLRWQVSPEHAYAPKMQEGTFRVPVGIRWSQYEKLRDQRALIWVTELSRMGWDLCQERGITAYPGPYPAHDLHNGLPDLGMRECILRAWFRHRKPEPIRLELPSSYFEPLTIQR